MKVTSVCFFSAATSAPEIANTAMPRKSRTTKASGRIVGGCIAVPMRGFAIARNRDYDAVYDRRDDDDPGHRGLAALGAGHGPRQPDDPRGLRREYREG